MFGINEDGDGDDDRTDSPAEKKISSAKAATTI
jgi:hypothetical protein